MLVSVLRLVRSLVPILRLLTGVAATCYQALLNEVLQIRPYNLVSFIILAAELAYVLMISIHRDGTLAR